jgi:hypothetical protein
MDINLLAVLAATVVQFIIGFVWYGPLFGGLWGKIHGFDKLSKEVQQKMMKEMGPYYGMQLVVTVITSGVLSWFVANPPAGWGVYTMAFLLWLGFIVPAQVSAVIFGGTDAKWIGPKIGVQTGGALACIMAGTAVLTMML